MKSTTAKEVSAFDAKTHLSALLRETEKGQSFVIHRRGKPVAQLGPPPGFDKDRNLFCYSRNTAIYTAGNSWISECSEAYRRRAAEIMASFKRPPLYEK